MAHPFPPNPQQFASPYLSWPPTMFSPHYPYHPGYSSMPQAQPYPPTGQYVAPGQFHSPPLVQPALQPPSNVQMLGQELVASQTRLLQYTDMLSSLSAQLETIRNIVCPDCREKISPGNLGQHPSLFASQIPVTVPSALHNGGSQQTAPVILPHIMTGASVSFPSPDGHSSISPQSDFQNTQLTTFHPASPIPTQIISNVLTLSDSAETPPPETPPMNETAVIVQPIIEEPQWSVIYNTEAEKVLDVAFVHAFEHTHPVCAVRFSPDGKFLAAVLDCDLGKTQIYDMETRSMRCALAESSTYPEKKESPLRGIWCVCFSPDGRYLVVGSSFEMIYVWEIAKKRVLTALKGHAGAVWCLDLSPDGRLLVTGSNDCSVRIWKMRDGSSKPLSTAGNVFKSVKFTPNGCYVVASNDDRFLRIWDVRSGQLVGKWKGHQAGIRSVAISPDGEELASGSWGGGIKSWDISSLETPPRSGLSAAKERHGMLLQQIEKLKFEGHSGEVRTVVISPDGKWVVTGSTDKRVRIWDMHTAVQQCTLEGHLSVVWAVEFSPVGNYIAIGSGADFVMWRYSEKE